MKRTPALPTVPLTSAARQYRSAAKTDVATTIDAERKRIGALTGKQVRDARKKAAAPQPDTVVTTTADLLPGDIAQITKWQPLRRLLRKAAP